MAIAVEMPKMTDTMEEGVLIDWLVEEGTKIVAGDIIAQVETDKATMDVEAYDDGVLLKKVAVKGDALPIGGLIAILGKAGEDVSAILDQHVANASQDRGVTEPAPASEPEAVAGNGTVTTVSTSESTRIKASPLARKMAADHGLDLRSLTGSGPQGRIIKRDIESALSRRSEVVPEPKISAVRGVESIRITPMRKAIARRLAQSKYSAPHFYLTVDVNVERLIAARQYLNEQAAAWGTHKISYNDLVTKAVAVALMRHPHVNATYDAEAGEIRQYSYVDIGIAVAIGDGLVTPVVRDVNEKGLSEIAEETSMLARRARNRELQPEEMAGSTFTTSNLGMFGIEEFTAIINPPNSAILAIGAIRDVPVVKEGIVVAGKRMKLTLSCDHRTVDGATGAQFLSTLQHFLEEPLSLLL